MLSVLRATGRRARRLVSASASVVEFDFKSDSRPRSRGFAQTAASGAIEFASEPSLASLGLAANTPAGFVQKSFEFLHTTLDVPWWGTIVVGTICVRMIIFPLVVKSKRDATHLNNNMPGLMTLQNKLMQARLDGDEAEAAKYAQELSRFVRERGANPFKTMIAPLAQMPFFVSFFFGLRGMTNLPVESMKHGGLLWFQDLTVHDPYFILPIITSLTLYVTINAGLETGKVPNETVFKIMKAIPFVMFPVTATFPAALTQYWACTNLFTLLQVSLLKIPRVQKFFDIPESIKTQRVDAAFKRDFMKDAKESFINLKVAQEMEERRQLQTLIDKKREEAKLRRKQAN